MTTSIKLTDIISPNFYDLYKQLKEDLEIVEVWLRGGRGSTKSSFISAFILLGLIRDKNANAVCFRRYENEIRGSVWNQLKLTASRLGIADKWNFIASPFQATYLPTGQKILFFGADKPEKIKSITLEKGYFKFAWFEEVDQFGGMEDLRNIGQSIIRGTDEQQIEFFSYNPPKSARSWANAETKIEKPGRIIHYSDYRDVPKEWLGQRFITKAKYLKETNESAYRHEYLGEEIGTGLEIFNNVTVRAIHEDEVQQFDNIRQGLDFGYAIAPLAFERMHYGSKKRRIYLFREVAGIGISNRIFASKLFKDEKREHTIADSAEPKSISELRNDFDMDITGAKKGPGSIEHGIKWLSDLEEIVIDPVRCPLAAKEFVNYALDIRRDGEIISKYPDKENHSIDATRYALENDSRTSGTVRPAKISARKLGL